MCGIGFESLDRVYYCPKCRSEYKKNYNAQNKDKIRKYNKERVVFIETPEEKECAKCKKNLSADKFYKDSSKNSGLSSFCKECKKSSGSNRA